MNNSIKIALIMVMTSLVVVSCDSFLDVNTDPNNPTDAPMNGLMSRTTLETARNTNRVGGTTSFFVQHFASPNAAAPSDTHESISYGNTWASLYGVLGDLADMNLQAEELGAPYYSGISKIMTAYNLSLLTNMFGDVPYSEALFAQTLNPPYDTSEDIYNDIFDLLDEAISDLESAESAVVPGDDDYIFGGDLSAWLRTAYALQARFLNHHSKLPSYDPEAVLIAVDNAFTDSDQDFQFHFFAGEGTGAENPWHRTAVNNAGLLLGGWLSTQLVDQLNGATFGVVDPRIDRITAPASDSTSAHFGEYVGTRNGAGRGSDPEQGVRAVLDVDSWYADDPTNPLEMVTFVEMKFIEAEAAYRDGQTGRAYTAYEDGIRAHMEKLGVDQADIDSYWLELEVSNLLEFGLDKIMKEKYVAMFLNPETWNDARRFDYAYEGFTIPANHNPSLGGEMIRLVRYPDSEEQRNASEMPDRTMLDRVFWDAN